MAIIHEEVVIIKLSKLVKDDTVTGNIVTDDIVAALEQVTQELLGAAVIVEIQLA